MAPCQPLLPFLGHWLFVISIHKAIVSFFFVFVQNSVVPFYVLVYNSSVHAYISLSICFNAFLGIMSTSKGTLDIAGVSQGQAPPNNVVQTSTNICKEPEG
jgi:hypothetical protein